MFKLIKPAHEKNIRDLIKIMKDSDLQATSGNMYYIINSIHSEIPEKKRISCGRYSIAKEVGLYMYPLFRKTEADILKTAKEIFNNTDNDQFVRSLCTQLLSLYGEETGRLETVLPVFEKAAIDDNWILRECAAGFIRKLIKKYPDEMHQWYVMMVTSDNPLKKRFAAESLRPVADNQWIKKNPDFAFSILEHLFREPESYPRTSAGNNLSDWMRIDRERTLEIVRQLAANGDKNSYWIAYRACRNLVKKEPLLAMDILKTDKYIYKDRKFFRENLK
ncbi:MAG: hypothetical protein JW864_04145 [Spirochaetes bacterium]|nr:hypothetical protein [Spirochaetota bacterium]